MAPHSRVRGWPVISRYTRPEIGGVWTQEAKLESWLEVELAATEAWAAEGVVPAEVAAAARERAAFTVEAVDARARGYRDALIERALEQRDTLCVGRTHGVHAEPTTFGLRLAGFAFEADRNLHRLEDAFEQLR